MQQNQQQFRRFLTIIEAKDQFNPESNELVEVQGPVISAPSFKVAQEELKIKGINYLKIVKEIKTTGEIKEELIDIQPDPLYTTQQSSFPVHQPNQPIVLPKLNIVR